LFADILEPYTLNVFTDASLRKISNVETWVSSGVIAVYGNTIVSDDYRVYKNQTSNYAELKAIKLGINIAQDICRQVPSIKVVNLFSDSQISIYGIRDRIFNWRIINNTMVGYGNKIIANQDIFLEIMNLIVMCNLHINFWHQKGHSDESSIQKSRYSFITSNRIVGANESNVDFEFIKYINRFNQMVDNASRKLLYQTDSMQDVITPISFLIPTSTYHQEVLNQYNHLINGGN
jgi:ribonuclease HI